MKTGKTKTARAGKKVRRMRMVIVCVAVVAAAVVVLVVIRRALSSSGAQDAVYVVRSEVYKNEISVAGTVSAAQEQTLQALSDGTVVAVYVEQGDHVKEGDTIIQLDDTEQQYNLARHDYDMETTRISGSQKELALMETERLSLVQKIAERKVSATFDGIIADIDVYVGDSLEAKDSVGTLVDVSYLIADVEVAETDVSKLAVGQEVEFTFPSYTGAVTGYVTGWPAIGEVTDRGATVVEARLRIDDYPEVLLPNFSFSGKIKISPDETFLVVERYAIGNKDGKAFAVRVSDSKTVELEVESYSGDYVKILSGDVKAGDALAQQSAPKASGSSRRGGPGGMGGPPPGMM